MHGQKLLFTTVVVSGALVIAIHAWQQYEAAQGIAGLQRDDALRQARASAQANNSAVVSKDDAEH